MLEPEYMQNSINKFVGVGTVPNVNNAESYITKFVADHNITENFPIKNFMRLGIPLGKVISAIYSLVPNLCGLVVHKVVENDITTITWISIKSQKIYFYMNQVEQVFKI